MATLGNMCRRNRYTPAAPGRLLSLLRELGIHLVHSGRIEALGHARLSVRISSAAQGGLQLPQPARDASTRWTGLEAIQRQHNVDQAEPWRYTPQPVRCYHRISHHTPHSLTGQRCHVDTSSPRSMSPSSDGNQLHGSIAPRS